MCVVRLPFVLFLFGTYFFNTCSERPFLPPTDPLSTCPPKCIAKVLGDAEKHSLSSAVRITYCLTFN